MEMADDTERLAHIQTLKDNGNARFKRRDCEGSRRMKVLCTSASTSPDEGGVLSDINVFETAGLDAVDVIVRAIVRHRSRRLTPVYRQEGLAAVASSDEGLACLRRCNVIKY